MSIYDKMPIVKPVLHFSSDSALFEKDGLKCNINRMHKFAHTNKYRCRHCEVMIFP